jgi:YYY domain-containing protein
VDYSGWFGDTVRWYIALMLITWGFAPAVRWLLGGLSDKGAAVARPAALLFVLWPTWFLSGSVKLPYTSWGIWITLAIGAAICWGYAWKRQWIERDWIRTLLIVEAVSLATFAAYVGLRGFTPQLAYTEKPMDMMFLTASYRTDSIPPADAWMSGETINYYYLGYLIYGTLSRIAGISTWIGYNLALATTASMASVAAGGAAYNIVRRGMTRRVAWMAAVLGGFFVVVAGNMRAAVEFVRDPSATWDQGWWGTVGWASSRVIVDEGQGFTETINEFPWFSLLLGDLHPHLTALPFTILAIVLAISAVLTGSTERPDRAGWGKLMVAGMLVGALYPLNSLDFPTYLVLLVLAIAVVGGWNRRTLEKVAVVAAASLVAWLPFTLRFVSFAGGDTSQLPSWLQDIPVLPRLLTTIAFYKHERTSVGEFLTIFGLFWAIALLYLGLRLWQRFGGQGRPEVRRWVIAACVIVLLAAVAIPMPVLVLAGAPLGASLWLVERNRREGTIRDAIPEGLYACGFGLIVLTEVFYVQDAFNGRFNTLFKVYYQVWAMLGIACAVAVLTLIIELRPYPALRTALGVAGIVGLLAAFAYPVIATQQWTREFGPREWKGLNSAAFMADLSADDLAAMHWLYDNAESDDVIIEMPGCAYQVNGGIPTSGLAAMTGVPTIIGWGGHEGQWRDGQPELLGQIGTRQGDVAAIYADPSSPLVDQYDATLLYVGNYERYGTPNCVIPVPGSLNGETLTGPYASIANPEFPGPTWEPVFTSGETSIYRRVQSTA